ncbi:transposase [Solibacillus sp. FSL H8-0538]|uniref:transposase n=1 Tax=Solibacillus sp. FSL H8-0538 TaxID=2921400 RepID=UPI004046A64E
MAPSFIANMLKGISAGKLFIEFPALISTCGKGRLWANSFYLEMIGAISEDAIETFLLKKGKVNRRLNLFYYQIRTC